MPTYDYTCSNKKSHNFEQYLSFADYDVLKDRITCPTCGSVSKIAIPDEPPDYSISKSDNVGKIAENNSKKMGKFGVEDATIAEKKRRKVKPERKTPWYGQMSKAKTNEIFNEPNAKKRKAKIAKYVIEGE